MNKLTEDQVKEHARLSAAYFNSLCLNGVSLAPAVELTSQYARTLVLVLFNTSPKEPWET